MISRATLDIERAGFPRRAIRVKGVTIRPLIVLVAREATPRTHTKDLPAGLYTPTAGRTVGIKQTRCRLNI